MELQCALACPPVLRRRSTIALMVATALALPLAGPHAGADSDDEAAERAAAEIAAAKERANDAAAAYFDALSELDQLEDEAKRLAADARRSSNGRSTRCATRSNRWRSTGSCRAATPASHC